MFTRIMPTSIVVFKRNIINLYEMGSLMFMRKLYKFHGDKLLDTIYKSIKVA